MLSDRIDHHVPGASIKGDQILQLGVRRNRGEVCYSADVLQDTACSTMPKKYEVKIRHQRRAVASGGHVSGTEVGNHRYSKPRSDHRTFAELPSAGDLPALEG